jgi:hypothetical protein
MGMLLEDIYQCSETGGGALKAIFPDQVTQEECQTMINYLSQNKIAYLIDGGVPDTTEIAHKHSWTTFNGIMYTLGDAGIVYSPGGEYILVIFMNHPVQIIWDNASLLVGKLSEAIYNFYNLPAQ